MKRIEDNRPDPEELLRRVNATEQDASRGRLKIFLGYAPRTGKSQRMFDEGRRRKQRSQDVVVGSIQLKGSADLQPIISSLEVIPLKQINGGETVDVDSIIARNPQVCLIDELAQDNPPGSKHAHRYEDVLELLDHGIKVVSALNVQHVAEQQDAVERVTGKRARAAVPEDFLRQADEIVLVDLAPDELLKVEHGLSECQLSQLRELAFLLAAEVVESQLQRYMELHGIHQTLGAQERILVSLTPRSNARRMIETGRRNADRFHGQLLVAYVKQPELNREDEETIEQNLEYAQRLGAEVHTLESGDPIASIVALANSQRITQIFAGHSQKSKWKFWEANPLDRLIKAAEGMDVRVFPHN